MPEFTIEILTHAGAVEAEIVNPTNLKYTFQIGANGPSKCEWSVAESDDVVLAMDGDTTMPKRKDFRLMMDGFPLMAGFLDSVNMPLASDEIHFTGVDWLEWLNQDWRGYYNPPMNYDSAGGDDIDAIITTDDADEFHAVFLLTATVQDWIDAILAPLSENAGEQVLLTPITSGTTFTELLPGTISRSSGKTALGLLQELASMGDPYGFDFWMNWNKELYMVGPRQTDPLSASPIATMTESSGTYLGATFNESPIVDGDWTNNGPLGTDILFRDGLGNAMRYFRKVDQDSVNIFRRWGAHADVGSGPDPLTIGTDTELEFKAAANAYRMIFPQRELTLTVKPEYFTFDKVLMDPIRVTYQKFPGSFRQINASFWVTSQTYREAEPGSGDWLCDLTLDQIYDPV